MDNKLFAIQTELKKRGFDPGPLDGIWGNQTRDAIAAQLGIKRALPVPSSAADAPWFELAKAEIGVKEVPGAGNSAAVLRYFEDAQHPDVNADAVPWCFTGETEILTDLGFVRFDALPDDAVVYQSDDAGALSLARSTKITKSYAGDVFDIGHASVRLTCDIGHRWFGKWGKAKSLSFGTLDHLTAEGLSIPAVKSQQPGHALSDREIQLIAAFISDGKNRKGNRSIDAEPWRIEFEVSKPRKIAALTMLIPDYVYTQRKAYGPLTKSPLTVFSFDYPQYFKIVFSSYKRLSRDFVNGLSQHQAQVFLAAFSIFDGNGRRDKVNLYTSESHTRDDIATIALLAGYHSSIQSKTGSELSPRDSWVVAFAPGKKMRHFKRRHITRRHFNGDLYCVSVPYGRIVVRGPNSAPIVTGNCAGFVGAMLVRAGYKPSGSLMARSYLTWGTAIDKPRQGCIVVLKRGKAPAGHVGFAIDWTGSTIHILAGNQKDSVSIASFSRASILGFRWPRDAS